MGNWILGKGKGEDNVGDGKARLLVYGGQPIWGIGCWCLVTRNAVNLEIGCSTAAEATAPCCPPTNQPIDGSPPGLGDYLQNKMAKWPNLCVPITISVPN